MDEYVWAYAGGGDVGVGVDEKGVVENRCMFCIRGFDWDWDWD